MTAIPPSSEAAMARGLLHAKSSGAHARTLAKAIGVPEKLFVLAAVDTSLTKSFSRTGPVAGAGATSSMHAQFGGTPESVPAS